MKKLLLFLPMICLLACGNQEQKTSEDAATATLRGTIQNPAGETIQLEIGAETLESTLDESGSFSMKIPIQKPVFGFFNHGEEYSRIFLAPGMDLTLSLDTEAFDETIRYEGTGSAENNYLARKFLLDERLWTDMEKDFGQEETAFLQKVDSTEYELTTLLYETVTQNPDIHPTFIQLEQTNIRFYLANKRLSYSTYYPYVTGQKDVTFSDTYFNFLEKLDLNDSLVAQTEEGQAFIEQLLRYKTDKIFESRKAEFQATGNAWGFATLEALSGFSENQRVLDYAYYSFLQEQLIVNGAQIPEAILAAFREKCTNAAYREEIEASLQEWEVIAPGKPAPGFRYANLEGKEVSLEDFRGKFVYIDVWATWCGPCVAEIPHLEKLQEQYAENEDIVFISISIDDDTAAWERMVVKKEMKGVQLYADEAWQSTLCRDYLIQGIPRFILVQPDGTLYSAQAPRPSSKQMQDILEQIHQTGAISES